MIDFSSMHVQDLLTPEGFVCECGKIHKTDLKIALIGSGVVQKIAEVVRKLNCRKPFIVYDLNTYDAAGKIVEDVLEKNGIEISRMCFNTRARLMPAEWELGSIIMHFDPSCDLILGVGGGVINDLCKIIGKAVRLPTAIVATAPSMDGFASNSGAMEVNNIKTTLYTPVPSAVICDTDILCEAPLRMIWAGIGDMAAKFVSIFDWRISHLVNGEYYCQAIADIMRKARNAAAENMEKALQRDKEAIAAIVEGLVLAGIAMSFSGVSRPASGLEHCFSHIWEMMALERGCSYDLHGIQVGVGTSLASYALSAWRKWLSDSENTKNADLSFDRQAWEDNVRRVFGNSAGELIASANKSGRNDPRARRKRAETIIENREEILKIMDEELASLEEIIVKMKTLGIPTMPSQIGISDTDALDAFVCSRDIRDRYLSTSMMWDAGALQVIAKDMKMYLENEVAVRVL